MLFTQRANFKQKSFHYYGFIFALLFLTWWFVGLVYILGHTLFVDLLPHPLNKALSYPIGGLFLVVSEYLLSVYIHLIYHLLLVILLGFDTSTVYGLLKRVIKQICGMLKSPSSM